jgi:hypothetical protein
MFLSSGKIAEKVLTAGFPSLTSPAARQLLIQINEVTEFRVFQE